MTSSHRKQTNTAPANRDALRQQIASAQTRLYDRMHGLDPAATGMSEYNQRYLQHKMHGLTGYLQLYGRLLLLALRDRDASLEELVLVDYGGGTGLISLLAREVGIGTVVYNDIYDVSCRDVVILADRIGLGIDHVVPGDTGNLVAYLQQNDLVCDAVVSYDVLEHIYDVASHFRSLSELPGPKVRVIHASTANGANPMRVRLLRKLQREAEHRTREKRWGHKDRDCLEAYLDVRRRIITEYAPELSADAVDTLAVSTRGLIRADIESAVNEFRASGSISCSAADSTNTCDPYTGNWCEHLLDFDWLREVALAHGFEADTLPDRYDTGGPLVRRCVKRVLNALIGALGGHGLLLSSRYMLYAERTSPPVTNETS